MIAETYSPAFWQRLTRLRSISRLVLAALEEDDVDRVKALSEEAEERMGEIRPIIESRLQDPDRTEDDEQLADMVGDLKLMNDRILDVLSVKTEETRRAIGEAKEARLRLMRFKATRGGQDARVIDRRG
ncbi:MAG TPA: hypothetical protein ENK43_16155 [Planctomycetes bacterium]|nr:hypothetical protein [Planctomycetota bacterium]